MSSQSVEVGAPILDDPTTISKSRVVTIAELNSLLKDESNKNKYFIVQCTIKVVKNGWCYTGCKVCTLRVEEDVDEYHCSNCKVDRKESAARFRVQLQVVDSTNEIADFIILDTIGEAFFGIEANTLFHSSGANKSIPPQLLTNLVDTNMQFQVQVNSYNITSMRSEFTVSKILSSLKDSNTSSLTEVRTPLATSLPSSHSINSFSSASQVNNDKTHAVAVNEHDNTSEDLTDDTTMTAIQAAAKKRKKSTKD